MRLSATRGSLERMYTLNSQRLTLNHIASRKKPHVTTQRQSIIPIGHPLGTVQRMGFGRRVMLHCFLPISYFPPSPYPILQGVLPLIAD